jgi:hypothetical protein
MPFKRGYYQLKDTPPRIKVTKINNLKHNIGILDLSNETNDICEIQHEFVDKEKDKSLKSYFKCSLVSILLITIWIFSFILTVAIIVSIYFSV